MNIWNIQPEWMRKNLIECLTFQLIVTTITTMYNFYKSRAARPFYQRILKAQALRDKASNGMQRNERRVQILDKYIKGQFRAVSKLNQRPNPMQMMQNANPNQPLMPQMPQMSLMPLVMKFGPMLIGKWLFADKPSAVLYLPLVAKLERREDKVLQFLLKAVRLGRKDEEHWEAGYCSRTFVGFVFSFVYRRILSAILFGKVPKLSLVDRLQMQQELMLGEQGKVEKGKPLELAGNEDLKAFEGIQELSEVEAGLDNGAKKTDDSTYSDSKL